MIEIILCIGVLLILLLISVMFCDTHRFVTRETALQSKKIKRDTTIVVLSDLHNKTFGKENGKLIAAIEKAHPDMILIAGDMLNAHPGADFSGTVSFLKALSFGLLKSNEHSISNNAIAEAHQNAPEDFTRLSSTLE